MFKIIVEATVFNPLLAQSIDYAYTHVYLIWEQDHVEGYLELSAKTKTYFVTAVSLWDADFYVKVDDDVHVNIGMLMLRAV